MQKRVCTNLSKTSPVSNLELFLVIEVLVHAHLEEELEGFSHICRRIGTGLKVAETSFLAPLGHVSGIDLASRLVTLVTADDDLNSVHVHAKSAHLFLPVHQRLETVPIVHIVNHDDAICILVELLSDQPVVIVA